MKRFEYKIFSSQYDKSLLNSIINSFGNQGWELVSTLIKNEKVVDYVYFYFKRELNDKPI